ncbi:MAG: hypothetical protein U1A05_02600 [Alphaproteobacteria bacterium]|nr:hypothetical protein [Alphaproteobacteria bacterium]
MTVVRILWIIMGLLLLTGIVVLSMWGIPAPSVRIEKIIPNDKLPQ